MKKPEWMADGLPDFQGMREQGMNNKEIAAAVGCAKSTVSRHLPSQIRYVQPADIERAKELRAKGYSWSEVGTALGFNKDTIGGAVNRDKKKRQAQKPEPARPSSIKTMGIYMAGKFLLYNLDIDTGILEIEKEDGGQSIAFLVVDLEDVIKELQDLNKEIEKFVTRVMDKSNSSGGCRE